MTKWKAYLWAGVLVIFGVTGLFAAPQAELWPRWQAHNPQSQVQVDHRAWDRFLQTYVDTNHPSGVHVVRYPQVSTQDRLALEGYIESLESIEVSNLAKEEQLAYWVNMYNAVTVDLILENYPLESIRDIRRPWDTALVRVENEELTLNDIEHRILRPIWNDPRIHYVVNCASSGCPNLQNRAFTRANWDEMFTQAAIQYINHPRGANFTGRQPVFSSIYDWYGVDFGNTVPSVVAHMKQYAQGSTLDQLLAFESGGYGRVRYEYDWTLNAP
ncbi:MAG: DUF547 domain-containing protein [Spirochaetales bacterium]|nr:DUF547 domain-containing protein [Spirochaetales bacterium]